MVAFFVCFLVSKSLIKRAARFQITRPQTPISGIMRWSWSWWIVALLAGFILLKVAIDHGGYLPAIIEAIFVWFAPWIAGYIVDAWRGSSDLWGRFFALASAVIVFSLAPLAVLWLSMLLMNRDSHSDVLSCIGWVIEILAVHSITAVAIFARLPFANATEADLQRRTRRRISLIIVCIGLIVASLFIDHL